MTLFVRSVLDYLLVEPRETASERANMKHIITFITAALLMGCASEPNYLGDYSLTLPKDLITLKLASDGSFILAEEGRDNAVGTWKEKGDFLICEGTAKKDSALITVKFNRATLKLISLAKNGNELH